MYEKIDNLFMSLTKAFLNLICINNRETYLYAYNKLNLNKAAAEQMRKLLSVLKTETVYS